MLQQFWLWIVNAGAHKANSPGELKDIQGVNIACLLLLVLQVVDIAKFSTSNLGFATIGAVVFIALMPVVHGLMHMGRINLAKFLIITIINVHIIIMAYAMGVRTHIIDFLLISAIVPIYLFETRQWRMILAGITISIGPYAICTFFRDQFRVVGLPREQQLAIGEAVALLMMTSIVALIYLIYRKNRNYEWEAHQNEDRLKAQKQLYEQILESIPIGIVTFDKNLRYTYLNSAAVKDDKVRAWMHGKTNEEYFKMRNLDLSGASKREEILHEAIGTQECVEREESIVDRFGKHTCSIKGAAPVYNDDKSELLTLIGYSLDITSIKDAERQVREYAYELERRNEELQHFVYATSHDLKSPLRNIASHLQILQRRNYDKLDTDSQELINYTVQSVKHLNQLINDIYQYSVADRNDKPAENISLVEVVSTILNDHRAALAERNAKVEYNNLPELKMAPGHISMLLTNLMGNAIKYNENPNPTVHVYSHESDTEFIFTIADNGIGISPEYHKQIFEIFRRLHTADAYEGTGVGLAICKKIVENYGGRIWVESEQGKGSKFHFSLLKTMVMPDCYVISPYDDLFAATG